MKRFVQQLGIAGVTAAAVIGLAASAGAYSKKGNEITLRVGSGHPPFIMYVKQIAEFFIPRVTERVAKETKYTIKFRQHYSATVVNVFDTLEGVQDGRLDIGGFCVCFDDDKAMALNLAYYVPFSTPDGNVAVKVFRKVLDEFPEIAQDLEKRYNQKLLAITGFNNYGLLSAFDWKSFEDLKGHKILAAGANLSWVKGGIPVRTTIPKAAQQLQTGVGDAIILFPDTMFKLKLHEATKGGVYTSVDFGAVVQIALTMNLRTRKRMPPEVVKIIDEVAREYETVSMAASMKDHGWGIEMLGKAGVKIKTIDPAVRKAWAEALKDWPSERAQAVKAKKGVDMPKILRAYMKYMRDTGYKFPVDYVIAD